MSRRTDGVFAHIEDSRLSALASAVELALRGASPLGVAFSGGVDSTLLLALAARFLGQDQVVAVVGVSPSLAQDERAEAGSLAELVGVRCVEVQTREGEIAEYRRNHEDRCYFCKNELFGRIDDEVAQRYGFVAIAYGETADDAGRTDRPGARAASERGVLRPLADAGFTKLDVRGLAHALGLPNWNKPAAPCLASRIPHYSPVIPEKLQQVETAERELRGLGFRELRVRHHDDLARVEVPLALLSRMTLEPIRGLVVQACRTAGFRYVTIDLEGLRSGGFALVAASRSGAGDLI